MEAKVAAAVVGNGLELVMLNDITQPFALPPKLQVAGMPRNSQSVPPPWLVFFISVSGEHCAVSADNGNEIVSLVLFITPKELKPIR